MLWSRKKTKETDRVFKQDKGLVLFYGVEDAIQAEKIINTAGLTCKLVAPPPALRKGCDIALEFKLVEQGAIQRMLQLLIPFQGIVPAQGHGELLDIIKVSNYEGYTMVKAGNMKVTFENESGLIVNTSGGGCPDIPYLHLQLVGRKLDQVGRPRDMGVTLCSLMLDRAVEGALELWKGGESDAVNSRDYS